MVAYIKALLTLPIGTKMPNFTSEEQIMWGLILSGSWTTTTSQMPSKWSSQVLLQAELLLFYGPTMSVLSSSILELSSLLLTLAFSWTWLLPNRDSSNCWPTSKIYSRLPTSTKRHRSLTAIAIWQARNTSASFSSGLLPPFKAAPCSSSLSTIHGPLKISSMWNAWRMEFQEKPYPAAIQANWPISKFIARPISTSSTIMSSSPKAVSGPSPVPTMTIRLSIASTTTTDKKYPRPQDWPLRLRLSNTFWKGKEFLRLIR